ncbi:hypothetical protein TUM20985_23870 [Mycobacterium antarcticum]|nr:hypothetical protein TUM20985_23870 [Mycolicibacterium sp. TUM20985]GLP75138.1 hypothetical protein TUM20983_22480 [Mycolicibacterium sp. TUM20983]GLP80921.1 hypothetical protein TUM20984_23410 [Mycolicibacterium sp. TUM20984]
MAQPISSGPGAALAAICEGSAKMPLPIMDPTTIAVRAAMPRPVFALAVRGASGGLETTVSDMTFSPSTRMHGHCCDPRH